MAASMTYTQPKVSKGIVLLIATLSAFITPFLGSSINVALPSIGQEFQLSAVALGWVANSYLLVAAMFLVPMGRIADIYGRKKIFIWGVVLYALTSLLCVLSTSAAMLISVRIIQGIAASMIFGTGIAMLTSTFPPAERGRVLGLNVASTYCGLSLGPVVGGLLTEAFGWRSIFTLNVFVGVIIIAAVLWKLKTEWIGAKGEKFDLAGSVIYGLSLLAVMYGFSRLPGMAGWGLLAAGIIGIMLFIRWEMKASHPVLNIDLFRKSTTFALSNLAAVINYSATTAVAFLMSLYLQYIKGLSPDRAGLILIAQPVIMAVVSPVIGRLSDKVEPFILSSIGMAVTTLGLSMFIFLGTDTSITFIFINLAILGLGFGIFSSPNINAIMGSVDKKFYGVASGTMGTMRLIGQVLSVAIAMLLFSLFMGTVQIAPQYYPLFLTSVKTTFIIFAAMCFAGIFASAARGKTRQKPGATL